MKNNRPLLALFAAFFLFAAASLPADKAIRRDKDFSPFIVAQDFQHWRKHQHLVGNAEK